jgi:hypothetical protein
LPPRARFSTPVRHRIMNPELRAFFHNDRFARHNGIELLDAGPGWAKVQMPVADQHLNAADVVHGGALFTWPTSPSPSPPTAAAASPSASTPPSPT